MSGRAIPHVGPLELALVLAFVVALVLAPTALFLALWRGLMALRDETLVERLEREGVEPAAGSAAGRATPGRADAGEGEGTRYVLRCGTCKTLNGPLASRCQVCGEPLD